MLTWEKSLRRNPVLGNPALNRLGLHAARVVLSDLLFRGRLRLLAPLASPEDRRRFRDEGFLVKRDVLAPAELDALTEEIRAYRGVIHERAEGDTMTRRAWLSRAALSRLPHTAAFVERPDVERLARYVSSKNRLPLLYAERVQQHAFPARGRDSQKDLHRDTFHPCVKAWLYLDDATEENGSFVFIPGSHRITAARLAWEHRESVRISQERRTREQYWDGSFRLLEEDRIRMGLPAPVAVEVPRNTLVVANVQGFHCRGEARASAPRTSVWMQLRDNPFVPLPSLLPPRLSAGLFERVWARVLAAEEGRANRRRYVGSLDDAG